MPSKYTAKTRKDLWSDAQDAILKSLWQAGKSAREIAEALSSDIRKTSRPAVIGRLHRLGINDEPRATHPNFVPLKYRTGPQKARRTPRMRSSHPTKPKAPTAVLGDLGPILGVSIHELAASSCRWPIGDPKSEGFCFCGRDATRWAYCSEHGEQGYQDPRHG